MEWELSEAREISPTSWKREPVTLVDLLGTEDSSGIVFEPERLGLVARTPDL